MSAAGQHFRAGAAAVIVNREGLVLALERIDIPGAWQLPQGGLKESEEPIQAVFREIREETSIPQKDLEILDVNPEPLAYELPASARTQKTGRGQVQYWFLLRFHGSVDTIDVGPGREFRAWKWTYFDELNCAVADFRRPVYRRLAERFGLYIARPSQV